MTTRPQRPTVFLLLAVAAIAAPCARPARGGDGDVPWFRRALVGMEVGPTGAQFGSDPSCHQKCGRTPFTRSVPSVLPCR